MKTRKNLKKLISWKGSSCNSAYFKSLSKLLNGVKLPNNTGTYIRPRFSRKARFCKNIDTKDCNLDEFHSGEKYLQIILGRFQITSNCYVGCKNYFAMALNNWSMFKNDTFIHHLLRSNFFYKKYNLQPLDPVFPIRIVLSKQFVIPSHKMKAPEDFIKSYGYDFFKGTKGISNRIINHLLEKYPELTKEITNIYPRSTITSRELCILNQNKLYFYVVKYENKYKPYVFVSEKPLTDIKNIYNGSDYEFEYL